MFWPPTPSLRTGMRANTVEKFFRGAPILPDTWELTRGSNHTSANIASGHSQSRQTCNATCATFTTRRNRSSAPSATEALDSRPIWTGMWRSMKLVPTPPWLWTARRRQEVPKRRDTLTKSETSWVRSRQTQEVTTLPRITRTKILMWRKTKSLQIEPTFISQHMWHFFKRVEKIISLKSHS